ncbi:dienelactone hydrolase family protein [Pseudomonas sp.]
MLNGDLPSKPPGLFLDTLETIVTQKNIHAAVGEIVTFKRPDGKDVSGYLASPANADGAPAIVVIQEWWGLNDQIRGVADRLATAGYVALVPDLYRGEMTVEQEEAQHLMSKLDFADAATQDIRGAVLYLNGQSRKVGVTGFCMGGALTLLSLNFIPELAAGVVFYGLPPLEYLDPKAIKVPVQAHWATQDEFFSTEDVDKLEAKLIEGGVDVEFHRYLAHHAFANETAVGYGRIPGTQYDPVWAQLAYDRTLTFFGRTMWG